MTVDLKAFSCVYCDEIWRISRQFGRLATFQNLNSLVNLLQIKLLLGTLFLRTLVCFLMSLQAILILLE